MLIPQFTIRWLLVVTAVCAALFSVVGLGFRGRVWAAAFGVGLGSLAVLMLVYAGVFALVWLAGEWLPSLRRAKTASAAKSPQEGPS